MRTSMPLGNLDHGLYYTSPSTNIADSRNTNCQSHTGLVAKKAMYDFAKLWHLRLGHAPFSKLKALYPDIDDKNIKDNFFCTICPASRQPRLPFKDSYIKTSQPFDLLHLDVWGPYSYKTHTGCTYFLTTVDDFTRFSW